MVDAPGNYFKIQTGIKLFGRILKQKYKQIKQPRWKKLKCYQTVITNYNKGGCAGSIGNNLRFTTEPCAVACK